MKRDRWITVGVAVAALMLIYRCDASAREEIGALNLRAKQLETDKLSLMAQAGSLATRFRTETVTVRVTADRWRTLIDSFTQFDTVQLTRRETLIVERANQALGACQDALGTCIESLRIRDRLIANRDSALRVELARRPTLLDKARTAIVFLAAGYALNAVTR